MARRGSVNMADLIGRFVGGATLLLSLCMMGVSASVVAHDHSSKIGIVHLVVSSISILCVVLWLMAGPSENKEEDAGGVIVVFFTMLMYLGAVIALAVDPISRAAYLNGKKSANTDDLISAYPYYWMFIFDILIM
ncbi:hypothetical protein B0H13DRAFT_2369044 [Mycena leptocephala]|nr:hypothetical protein B0H13DRAFT_2369044 [Mycena leptocephala]